MIRSHVEWLRLYEDRGVIWRATESSKYHPILASKRHSGVYLNSRRVINDPVLCAELASDLLDQLLRTQLSVSDLDWVAGPPQGATKLAESFSEVLGRHHGKCCKVLYLEKQSSPEGSKDVSFTVSNPELLENGKGVVIEDVLTTGVSFDAAVHAVRGYGGIVHSLVPILVNRSDKKTHGGSLIVSIIDLPVEDYDAAECPYCANGSIPLDDPKDNSHLLT